MTIQQLEIEQDLINSLLKLKPQDNLHQTRQFRDKVLLGTQASYDAIFDSQLSLPLGTRYLIAIYASQLSEATELTLHYIKQAEIIEEANKWLPAIIEDNLSLITDPILKEMLTFTRTLTLNPIDGDKKALLTLEKAGIPVPDCIALAQLIAFLSYQIRLVTGLKAMQALEKKNEK